MAATETLRKEGIEAPEEFIRDKVPSARLLGAHFVTADFIASVEGSILEHIERQMWSDLKVSFTQLPIHLRKVSFILIDGFSSPE